MPKIVPVSHERHGLKSLMITKDWHFTADQHLVPLLTPEFLPAAQCLPIVFAGKEEQLGIYAVLGLKPGENHTVDGLGQWLVKYIPAFFRRYPFSLVRTDDSDKFVLCVDEESGLIVQNKSNPLFNMDGSPSPLLQRTQNFLLDCQKRQPAGFSFCALLRKLDLLETLQLTFPGREKKQELKGMWQISESKLHELADEDFLQLRAAGVLPLVYAHLLSLSHLLPMARNVKSASEQRIEATALPDRFKF